MQGFLRRRSPGHVCPFQPLYRQVPGSWPGTADQGHWTKRRLYNRRLPVTGTRRRPRGRSVGRAGVADQCCGRPRLQPSDPGPGSTSLPVPGPLTGVVWRRPLGAGHSRGPQKRKQWQSRKREQGPLPAPPGSRKSLWRRGLREAHSPTYRKQIPGRKTKEMSRSLSCLHGTGSCFRGPKNMKGSLPGASLVQDSNQPCMTDLSSATYHLGFVTTYVSI
ncbi:uncharacterized protein LOC122241932 [Panthera tigris]|uniref:uncharacterized protein LOC122241932 n=1 Tax=Panthera tigris TaxID=9694 RepID=UPI001C6FB234|nr:uncharacterized protein LOC122241932 [Panthera tigris]